MALGRGKAMVIGLWQEVQLFPLGPVWPSVSWSRATLRRLPVNQGSSNTAVREAGRPRGSCDSRGLRRIFPKTHVWGKLLRMRFWSGVAAMRQTRWWWGVLVMGQLLSQPCSCEQPQDTHWFTKLGLDKILSLIYLCPLWGEEIFMSL